MKITILTIGTRGDVQPYLALGKAFREQGHQVTICTCKNFEIMVSSYGIDFVPIEADFQAFLCSDIGRKMIKKPFGARKHLKKWVYPMIYDALHTFYALARDSDKVLFNVKTLADHFADQFPEKMIRANVVPTLQPTNEFANPALRSLLLPSFLNKFSYKLYEMSLQMMKSQVSAFRKDVGLPKNYQKPELLSIYGISNRFLNKPKDFPANNHFTGFWQDTSSESLPQDLLQFIDAGTPPLLITFGSMPFDSKMDLTIVIKRIIRELKTRVILVTGWGISNTEALEDDPDTKIIDAAPFDQLFPLVKAVIHHGGAGTTSTCLLAGKPFFTCPVLYPIGDQEFWGTIAFENGVAVKPVPLKRIKESTMIDKVRELLKTPSLYQNSEKLMRELNNENGLLRAVSLVENAADQSSISRKAS